MFSNVNTNETDWQELLDDVAIYASEAKRKPQQHVLDIQRLQILDQIDAAVEAARFQIKNGRCA